MQTKRYLDSQYRLKQSFRKLLITTDYNQIDITMIAEAAGMSRKNFYFHFKSKEDLYNSMMDEKLAALEKKMRPYKAWDSVVTLCRFLYNDREFYRAAISISTLNEIAEMLREPVEEIFIYEISGQCLMLTSDMVAFAIWRWIRSSSSEGPLQFLMTLKKNLIELSKISLRRFTPK